MSGKNCRMDCEYCTDDAKYGGYEHEVEEYFKTHDLEENSVFSVVGGEPSFAVNHMKTIFETVSSKISNFKFEMFTNCTNLSKEFIDFVKHDDRIKLLLSVEIYGGNKRKIGYDNTISLVRKAVEKYGQFATSIAIVYDENTVQNIEKTISDYSSFLDFEKAKLMFESRRFKNFKHLNISNEKITEMHCKNITQKDINDKLLVSDVVGFFSPNCIKEVRDIELSKAELFINAKKINGDFTIKNLKNKTVLRCANGELPCGTLATLDVFVDDELIFHDMASLSYSYKHSHLDEYDYIISKGVKNVS